MCDQAESSYATLSVPPYAERGSFAVSVWFKLTARASTVTAKSTDSSADGAGEEAYLMSHGSVMTSGSVYSQPNQVLRCMHMHLCMHILAHIICSIIQLIVWASRMYMSADMLAACDVPVVMMWHKCHSLLYPGISLHISLRKSLQISLHISHTRISVRHTCMYT
jgi:hypothetical protein